MVSLKEMFEQSIRFANWARDVQVLKECSDPGFCNMKIRFFTNTHEYNISARYPSDGDLRGYLGCIATTRKSRAGEDLCRGNDLPDGPYCEKTWKMILGAIVGYELVNIHNRKSRQYQDNM